MAVVFLLIFLHSLNILSPLEKGLSSFMKPVQWVLIGASRSVSSFFERITNNNDLFQENIRLNEKISELTRENSLLKTTLKENEIIAPQVKFLQEKNYNYVMARVISRSVDPTFKAMTINQGKQEGVEVGMPVVANQGYLVGKIIRTESNRAEVLLLNDARSNTSAQIQNESASPGIVAGEFGLTLKMDFIPKDDAIENSQSVISSGLENYIPKGLLLGKIESIKTKAGDFFQTAYLTPFLSYDQLEVVSIITHY
ncbi:MAG: rod shape-determining protein MreC [Patescibacteria group bacterium]